MVKFDDNGRIVHVERQHRAIKDQQADCATHGAFKSTLWALDPMPDNAAGKRFLEPFWSSCPVCDAANQAAADALNEEALGGMSAKQRAVLAKLDAAEIPQRLRDATLDNWLTMLPAQKRVLQWARSYCGDFDDIVATGRSTLFTGSSGTGKTRLAVSMLNHVMRGGGTGIYTTVMQMLGRIKSTYGKNATENEAEAIAAFTGVDLLVIDEVGRQIDTNYEHAQLFRTLNQRYDDQRPTILITNMSTPEVKGFLGEAVVDRLRENGGTVQVFKWASMRGAA